MNESVAAALGGGIAWQGDNIDSELAEDIDAFYGNWDGDIAGSVGPVTSRHPTAMS